VVLIILKNISVFIVIAIFLGLCPKAEALNPIDVSAQSCVLMYEDGQCIFEKNADEKRLIASTTKLMTAIVCIEEAELDDRVKIKPEHCNVEGSSMYLKAGETYSVKELLLGLLLASGNDAALALSDYVAGGNEKFTELMNKKAADLEMKDSCFANPHGLDARNHYSTARDMAKLMLYCMENDTFRELNSTYTVSIKNNQHVNHNKLLKICKGCVGGKTGFTEAAGRCLVSCVERDGMRLVCVTFSAPNDWQDHIKLYDYACENYHLADVLQDVEYFIPVVSGSKKYVRAVPEEKLKLLVNKKEKIELKAEIPYFIFSPVKMGETAGEICVIIKNNVVAKLPLVYAEDAVMAYPCLRSAIMEVSL